MENTFGHHQDGMPTIRWYAPYETLYTSILGIRLYLIID
jgi:hypothetical protein